MLGGFGGKLWRENLAPPTVEKRQWRHLHMCHGRIVSDTARQTRWSIFFLINPYIYIHKCINKTNRNSITISPNLCLIYFHFMSFLLIFRRSPNGKSLKISITNFHYLTAKIWKRGDASKSLFNYVHS